MACSLYYGIQLTENQYQKSCCGDFVFAQSTCVRTMKDWFNICYTFHIIQVRYGIDINIIKRLLRGYVENLGMLIDIPYTKLIEGDERVAIDSYGYSEFYENGYHVNYDFCEHILSDFEYDKEVNGILIDDEDAPVLHTLGVKLISLTYQYDGKFSFSFEELENFMKVDSVVNFKKSITTHPKLARFDSRFIVIGTTDL